LHLIIKTRQHVHVLKLTVKPQTADHETEMQTQNKELANQQLLTISATHPVIIAGQHTKPKASGTKPPATSSNRQNQKQGAPSLRQPRAIDKTKSKGHQASGNLGQSTKPKARGTKPPATSGNRQNQKQGEPSLRQVE
jgi:hypothetical protein